MQKNEKIPKALYNTKKIQKLSSINNIQNLTQLEKDIYILINYIRTNPLDFSNDLIKNNKNKKLTEEQIDLINFLEEKYNKEHLAPFDEIPEISEAAKNLLYIMAQSDKLYKNKNLKDVKSSSLQLRNRLTNYGTRTGRIFEHLILDIENAEDIVYNILKDENGRNMLLSNKMKYIGIGCCKLPSNIFCTVIDIVQDFTPFKKNRNIKYNNYISNNISTNKDIIRNNNFSPKMNIIINNTNSNNNEYIQDIMNNNNHNNQRKKNLIIENTNNNYKLPEPEISSMDSSEPNSYKSYNIIINNNKIIPIRTNLSNINDINDDKNKNNKEQKSIGFNTNKVGMSKSKSVYGFQFGKGRTNFSINKYQKLNRKEKLEILHKINQRKNNNSTVKNSVNFQNLIPLSPNYSINKKKDITNDDKCISPISPYVSKSIYSNINSNSETDLNNIDNNISGINKINDLNNNFYEINETSPSYQSSNMPLDNDYINMKNDLMMLKNILKEELKKEVKRELKNEIQKEKEQINDNNNNKIINNRNKNTKIAIYHRKYNSDFFITNKINNNKSVNKNNNINDNNNKLEEKNRNFFSRDHYEPINKKINNNMSNSYYYQNFSNNDRNNKEEHRIKNKNEIKKLIRLYNKEKDTNQSISNFHFGYKNTKNTKNTNKCGSAKIPNKSNNLFLIKYQKTKPKDQTFILSKNKTNIKNISKLGLNKKLPIKNILNNKQQKNKEKNDKNKIINSYRSKHISNKIGNELSIEMFLTENDYYNERLRYKTTENSRTDNAILDDIKLKVNEKDISYLFKTLSFNKPKNNTQYYTFKNDS